MTVSKTLEHMIDLSAHITVTKHSNSLLRLSIDSMPCICYDAKTSHQDEHLTGWSCVLDGHKTDGKGARAPQKQFPSRLYEMTSSDGRPIEYVFRHYEDTASYMEQYRRHHTTMNTGRNMQQAPEVFVMLHDTITGSLPLQMPFVR